MNNKAYKNHYLIYTRKSTDDADNQKNSIAYQKMEGLRLAKNLHLPIASFDLAGFCTSGIISERHTGFKEGENFVIKDDGTVQYQIERPKFLRLVSLLFNEQFKGVIFLCWDRASRNAVDDSILRKLMDRGIDVRFVQATYEKNSSGELHMDVDSMFSRQYSRVIKEKVTNTTRKLRDEGICTYRAPVGYLNLGESGNKPFDPERALILKRLFELCAEGTWSLGDLARYATEHGFTMPAVRRQRTLAERLDDEEIILDKISRPVTANNLHHILSNRFYIGEVRKNSKDWMKSKSHQPLIDETLFLQVQKNLNKRRTSVHYAKKIEYPYRGLFRCALCSRVYTPYEQKGIIYYGCRCAPNCENTNRNFNSPFVELLVGEKILGLQYTDEQKAEIKSWNDSTVQAHEEQRKRDMEAIDRQKRKVTEDLAYLTANKLLLLKTGVYTPESLLAEEYKLQEKLKQIEEAEAQSGASMEEAIQDTLILSELLKTIGIYYCIANPGQKERIMNTVFSELKVSEKTLISQCKDGFKVFELPFLQSSGHNTWLSELLKLHTSIKQSIHDIDCLKFKKKAKKKTT